MQKHKTFQIILLFLLLTATVCVSGLDTGSVRTPHKIPEVKLKVKIDGILDEEEWEDALVLTLNYEVEPGENVIPPVKTQVFLCYDAKNLYVGFKAYDPGPANIRAHVTDRDNTWNDDYVGIVLDTFNDSRFTHDFYCNPFGIQAEQIVTISRGATSWDAIWNSAGRITHEGYCVEMAIPFTSLRFQGKKGDQVWGIDLVRSYPRSLSHLIGLFPRDRSNNCYMCQADKVIGFKGARPGKNLEFDPTLSGIYTQEREEFPDGKFVKKNDKVEPGLTARWSFTPNLTLSAAINPDFSQVEADAAQLDINNQFALYYPEKRPFFLEGGSIFRSRFWAIYTRTVVDPEWGIKLTGKEGKHAIGFFTARDTVTNLIIPSSQSSRLISLDMKNISTALRYRYDLGRSSNIGIIITNREGDNYYNRIAGIDGDIRFSKKDRIWLQYIGSQTRYPDNVVINYNQPNGKFTGSAFDGAYSHSTRNVYLSAHYQDVTPNFRADVGFADQTGTKLYDVEGRYIWRKNPGHWYTTLIARNQYVYMSDHNDQLLQKYFRSWINYNGPLQSYFSLQTNFGKRAYMGKEFNDNYLDLYFRARPSGSLYLWLRGAFGDRIDFANVQAGTRVRLNPGIQYNLGRHFYLELDHVFERLNVDAGELYTANLSNIRLVYQFNRRAFLRTILQYADYQYNSQLYLQPRDPEYKHLFSQVLFSYKINPQTVLFLGYSDDYYGYSDISLKQNNYTFFLKIGYALVL
jgi:hypothetical protein